MRDTDHDELAPPKWMPAAPEAQRQMGRLEGHADVLKQLQAEAGVLRDEAFSCRALGQESEGKKREETAKYLLSLVASLPAKLRAP